MSTNSLTVDLVIGTDGHIDTDASTAAFTNALSSRIAELETEQTVIAEVVSALFDEHKGQAIAMPTLAAMAAQRLNAVPANYKPLTERVLAYVRANSQGKTAEDGSVERPSSLFLVEKGKGGGASRRSDRPVKA